MRSGGSDSSAAATGLACAALQRSTPSARRKRRVAVSDMAGIAPRRRIWIGCAVGSERLERARASLALGACAEPGEHRVDLADVVAREEVDGS